MGSSRFQHLSFVVLIATFVSLIQFGETHPSHRLDILQRDTAASTPNSIIKLVSIARSPAANGNRFSLKFTKYVDDVRINIQDNVVPIRAPDTVTEEPGGVWVATFDLPPAPYLHLNQWAIFTDPENYHMVAIMLNNTGSEAASHDFVELPVIHLYPETEAVYDSGEDVFIKAFVPRSNQTGDVVWNMRKSFMGVDLSTMEFYIDLDDEDLYTLRAPQELDDRIKANMTIHTSTRPVSGYLQLTTEILDTGGSLAQYIQVSREIVVRPSNQTGPYPTGFLTINSFPGEKSPNGNEMTSCRVGSECLIHCFAIGQAISGMEVKEVSVDGSLVDVPSAQGYSMTTSTSNGIFWTFHAELDSGDSQGITTFQCKASDDVHGTLVTKLIDVQATIEASIDSEGSNVTIEADPFDHTRTRLTFYCAVRGRPIPTVHFEGFAYHMAGDSPDQVITTGQDEAVMVKVVTVHSDTVTQNNNDVFGYPSPDPYCSLYDTFSGNYQQHTFRVPDFGSQVTPL